MQQSVTLARWESVSGKYYLEATSSEHGPGYAARGGGGFRPDFTNEEMVGWCEHNRDMFQPDANRTTMHRVK